jgi:hypothetical protein
MNWDAIGAVAEGLGAVGVIVSLAYLASQIRQNTRSMRASTYQALSDGIQQMNANVFSDVEFAEFLERALTTDCELSSTEIRRWLAWISAMFRHFHNAFQQHDLGALPTAEYRSIIGVALVNFRSTRVRASWHDFRGLYRDPFRAEMDALSKRAESERAAEADGRTA